MSIQDKLEEIVKPICEENGFYLVEVSVKGDNRRPVLQVFADNEKGITLGQCETLSRLIMDELDLDETFRGNYRLDVSSPGLDRPLTEDWEFRKNLGQMLKIRVREGDQIKNITGKLIDADAGEILVEVKEGQIAVKRATIDQAKVKIQW